MKLSPVIFPPGRERRATKPDRTGSATRIITTGTVLVAFLAACAAGVLTATITSTSASKALHHAGSRSFSRRSSPRRPGPPHARIDGSRRSGSLVDPNCPDTTLAAQPVRVAAPAQGLVSGRGGRGARVMIAAILRPSLWFLNFCT